MYVQFEFTIADLVDAAKRPLGRSQSACYELEHQNLSFRQLEYREVGSYFYVPAAIGKEDVGAPLLKFIDHLTQSPIW